jgi:hypothetical protein
MRVPYVIAGVLALVVVGCARLIPPDSIIALEVRPQQVNLVVVEKSGKPLQALSLQCSS